MFVRSRFQTKDMIAQHNLLTESSKMVDDGILRTTFGTDMGPINAINLKKAHDWLRAVALRAK